MLTLVPYYLMLQVWGLIVLGGFFYWLPTIIALSRGSESRFGIAALNFFLGWTLLGWICALVWAANSTRGYRTYGLS